MSVSLRLPLSLLDQADTAAAGRMRDRFEAFVALLLRWNRSIKLVAADDAADIYTRHIEDSLAVVSHIPVGARVIDVGAGGGFPSVVIAIARPAGEVVALEPIHKKHAFLATVKRELQLTGLMPLPMRDDVYRDLEGFQPFDVAVSRATFAVGEWLDRGTALVVPGGRVIAMEGREQVGLPAGAVRFPYPLGDRQRSLIVRTRLD